MLQPPTQNDALSQLVHVTIFVICVVFAGMEVVHMTACNVSGRIRLSCDTRWQPAEDPCDPCLTVWHTKQASAVNSQLTLNEHTLGELSHGAT